MAKFLSKIHSFLLAAAVSAAVFLGALGITACSSAAKYRIGILLYSWDDIQGQQIRSYAEYLKEGFDVDFTYITVGTDDSQHIEGIESAILQGCDAVFSAYTTAIDQSVSICEEAGVYYGLLLADTPNAGASAETLACSYFLGGVAQFGGDPAATGKDFAEAVNATDYTKIAGLSFPPFAFIDGNAIFNSFTANIDDSKTVYSAGNEAMPYFNYNGDYYYYMFTAESCATAVTQMFAEHPDIEVIVGMGSGMDYILPALRNSGHGDVKLLSLGYTDQVSDYLADGTLLAAGTNNYTESMASLFARAYDAMESDGEAWYSDRTARTDADYLTDGADGKADYTILHNVSEAADFEAYIIGDKSHGSITNDELKQCMLSFNENAGWADLTALTTRTLSDIKALRAQ